MTKPDGAYKRLQTLQNLDADAVEVSSKPDEAKATKELKETATVEKVAKKEGTEDESEIDKEAQAANSKRARLIASEALVYYAIGGVGARTYFVTFPVGELTCQTSHRGPHFPRMGICVCVSYQDPLSPGPTL